MWDDLGPAGNVTEKLEFRQNDLYQLLDSSKDKVCGGLDKVLMFTAPEDINDTVNTYMQRSSDFFQFVCNDLYPDAGGGNSSDPASLGNLIKILIQNHVLTLSLN